MELPQAITDYIDQLDDEARDRIITNQQWCTGGWETVEGYRCLEGAAGDMHRHSNASVAFDRHGLVECFPDPAERSARWRATNLHRVNAYGEVVKTCGIILPNDSAFIQAIKAYAAKRNGVDLPHPPPRGRRDQPDARHPQTPLPSPHTAITYHDVSREDDTC